MLTPGALVAALLAPGARAGAATTSTTSAPSTPSTGAAPTTTTAARGATTTAPGATAPGATAPTAPGAATTTSTTAATASTLPGGATVPPPGAEIPADEAALLGLLADVHSRLDQLATEISSLATQLQQNQANLTNLNAELANRQNSVYAADRKLDSIEVDKAAARLSMRQRAVEAYMHQPTGDLANMLLHLSDPAELVDARAFYRTLVDVQVNAVRNFDRLDRAAQAAADQAAAARDFAAIQQKAVASAQKALSNLRQVLIGIQAASAQQETEQTTLLSQFGQDKVEFEKELQIQEEQSAAITQLLASLSTPGDTTASPTGGYFDFPIPGAPINQPFGPNHDPFTGAAGFHPGVDFGAKMGTPIHAAGDGLVVFAGVEAGYGNYTCITHGHNVATCYAHQSAIFVKVGDQVTRDQVIGLVGTTGYSTGPHLHFEVRVNGTPVDPMPWLVGAPNGTTTTTTH